MTKDKLRVKKMLFFYLPHSTKSDNSTKQIIEKTLKRNPFNYEVVTSLAAIEEAVAVHAIEPNVLIWSSTFMSSKFFSSIKYKILLNHFPRSIEVGHKVPYAGKNVHEIEHSEENFGQSGHRRVHLQHLDRLRDRLRILQYSQHLDHS